MSLMLILNRLVMKRVISLALLTFALLLLPFHLAPVYELVASNLLVDALSEYLQIEELVLRTCVPELHGAEEGIRSVLDVAAKQILGRGAVENGLSSAVVCFVTWMEMAIMLVGILLTNASFNFLFEGLAVIGQALLELLEADVFEFR